MRSVLLLLSLLHSALSADPFRRAILDCSRVNLAFCCTTRIRHFCPDQCSSIDCNSKFYTQLFGEQPSVGGTMESRDGDAVRTNSGSMGGQDGHTRFREQPDVASGGFSLGANTPPQPAPFQIPSVIQFPQLPTIPGLPPLTIPGIPPLGVPAPQPTAQQSNSGSMGGSVESATQFPTLIPEVAEGGGEQSEEVAVTAPQPPPPSGPLVDSGFMGVSPDSGTTPKPRRRTTPDPRIIRPPDQSLVILGEYDEEDMENRVDQVAPVAGVQPPTPPAVPSTVYIPQESLERTHYVPATGVHSGTVSRTGGMDSSLPSSPNVEKILCGYDSRGVFACRPVAGLQRRALRDETQKPVKKIDTTAWRRNYEEEDEDVDDRKWSVDIIPHSNSSVGIGTRMEVMKPATQTFAVDGVTVDHALSNNQQSRPQRTIQEPIPDRINLSAALESIVDKFASIAKPGKVTGTGAVSGGMHYRSELRRGQGQSVPASRDRTGTPIRERPLPMHGILEPSTQMPIRTTASANEVFLPARPVPAPPAVAPPPPAPAPPPPAPPPPPQSQCGVAPNYSPCVSSQQASQRLLSCCRAKNLPAGCLNLCRYDITQKEIRAAMDRGACGIFHVAPFLECASGGMDNRECCRSRGVASKTGPQCEQFCGGGRGIGPLGIHHIVCGNALGDMMYCHHSGIRP